MVSVWILGTQSGDSLSGSGLTTSDWRFSGKLGQPPN